MSINNILTIRPRKIPEYLIYKNRKRDIYRLFSTKTGEYLGEMCARAEYVDDKRTYYPNEIGYFSYFISSLRAKVKRQGIGKTLINLARHESIRQGFKGKVHLIAKNITYEKDNMPVIAYRKMGFNSQYKWAIANADKYIKTGDPKYNIPNISIPMYLENTYYCLKYRKFCKKA